MTVGGRGWLPPGVEANGYAEGTPTPPDLKESFAVGADTKTGDPEVDAYWFPDNVLPAEDPELQDCVTGYLARMRALADELLTIAAAALGPGRRTSSPGTPPLDLHHEHQLVPADGDGRATRGRASSGSARTPTSAPSPSWTASPARAACRSGVRTATGRTRRTTRTRSPSTPATCWPAGAGTGGSPTGTGCCRRRPTHRTRTWCRWCSSTRPTGTPWSSRCSRRSAGRTATRRWWPRCSSSGCWTPSRSAVRAEPERG